MSDDPVFQCKSFADLTPAELYAILALRINVFMVEQNCLYSEADGCDPDALHLFAYHETKNEIALYTRIFAPNHNYHGTTWPTARIGRVAIHPDYRGRGLGHILMRAAMAEIKTRYGSVPIILSAQAHLQKFYEAHNFNRQGDIYDEDGLPHIEMVRA